jgi:hypothetical protein
VVAVPSVPATLAQSLGQLYGTARRYRLVDEHGDPHPVLDDLYDSPDAAWGEAVQWWTEQGLGSLEAIGIGVEVSTASGDWRTLRHPGA